MEITSASECRCVADRSRVPFASWSERTAADARLCCDLKHDPPVQLAVAKALCETRCRDCLVTERDGGLRAAREFLPLGRREIGALDAERFVKAFTSHETTRGTR